MYTGRTPPISDAVLITSLHLMAPEVAITRLPSDTSDIVAFGTLAYALLGNAPKQPPLSAIDLLCDVHQRVNTKYPTLVPRHNAPQPLIDIVMRCLGPAEGRYNGLESLAYELANLGPDTRVGAMDEVSRFQMASEPIEREREMDQMSTLLSTGHAGMRVVNVWGRSGSGKTALVWHWVKHRAQHCMHAGAKLDEDIRHPLASFSQVFQSLVDAVACDLSEDPVAWNVRVQESLKSHFGSYLALLSERHQRLAMKGCKPVEEVSEALVWLTYSHKPYSALRYGLDSSYSCTRDVKSLCC